MFAMDTRSADMPTRRWIGRGRGVLALSSQQANHVVERSPGNHGKIEGATLLSQNSRLLENSRMSDGHQQAVHPPPAADRRPPAAADRRPPAAADRRPPAAADRRPPAAADRRVPQNGSSDQRDVVNNSKVMKPQMQNDVAGTKMTTVKTLLAGYSYKANPDSPLGFSELNIEQGQKLALVEKHPTNEHWWKVQDETGAVGYVPANYVMIEEAKPSMMPWLVTKQQEQEDIPAEKPVWKPYVSAYSKPIEKSEDSKGTEKNDYYCRVCDKKLNGPKPYGAHVTSKAHKEEVEIARERGEDV